MKNLDIIKRKKPSRVALMLPEDDYLLLKALAKKNKTTLSEIVRAIIRDFFKTKGDK